MTGTAGRCRRAHEGGRAEYDGNPTKFMGPTIARIRNVMPLFAGRPSRSGGLASEPVSGEADHEVCPMLGLIIGIIVFLGAHGFTTFRGQREALIKRIGPRTYRI